MRRNARRLLIFSVKFVALFTALSFAWLILAPIYNAITATLANALFPIFENPVMSFLQAEGQSVAIYVRDPEKGPLLFGYLDYPNNGLIMFLALLLATPGLTWKRHWRLMMLAIGMLIGIQSILLVVKTRFEYINVFGSELPIPDSVYLRYAWLGRLLVPASLVTPFVLWALLTWRYWFPKPVAPSPQKKGHPKETRS